MKAQYEFTDVHTAFVSAKIDKVAEINDRKMLIVGFFAAVFLSGLYGDIAGLFTGVHVRENMTVAYNDAITFGLCFMPE